MQKIEELMREKAAALLQDGTADCVLAWRRGEFPYDHATAVFHTGEELEELTYDCFCPANLAKYLIQTSRAGQKAAVFLNGAKLPVGRSRMRIPVRKGTNRIVARIGVKADKYTKAVQMAICENGELCTPCTPVPFLDVP